MATRLKHRNTNQDLRNQLQPLIEQQVALLAKRLRTGLPVAEQEAKLQRYWLIQAAAPYWKTKDFVQIRTYLSLENG